ncbi:MAG: IPT/TIG domain-containing protein [Holophaga sp.]
MGRCYRYFSLIALTILMFCVGCGGSSAPASTAPTLSSFSPTSGLVGTSVTLTGTNLTGATAVRFNGTAASTFAVVSATQITATVPTGATSGVLSVTTGAGTGTSSGVFTVTVLTTPVVTSFTPAAGKAGDAIAVIGSGFSALTSVTLGGVPCAYVVNSASSLSITVPATAVGTGVIAITNTQGTGTSATSFAVQPGAVGMNPKQGPVGTPVVLTGTGFTPSTTVTFHGTSAAVVVQSATQVTATVPVGATTGAVSLSANGTNLAMGTFTVGSAGTTQDLSIAGAYLVQSVQDTPGTVPLVANRDAYLRVFVIANQASVTPPAVQVTLTNGGISWIQTLSAPGGLTSTPTTLNEGSWGSSWNLLVPAAQLQVGATLLVRVNPTGAVAETDGTNNFFPSNGVAGSLDVRTVKPFLLTLVSVVQQSLTGNVDTGRTLASWPDRLQRMYPIGSVDVQKRSSTLTTTADLNTGASPSASVTGWSQLLGELETKRAAEASSRYYYGAVNVSYTGGIAGLGYVGWPSAIGWDKTGSTDGYSYPEVLAHEVGHNFGRHHAPCGVTDPDSSWPTDPAHANAAIGVYGYDVAKSALKLPTAKDIMSYCDGNLWISDYTFKGVFAFRATSAIGDAQLQDAAMADDQECLLVSGRIGEGRVEVNSSFQVRTCPTPSGGSHALVLMDGQGQELVRHGFEPLEVADLPDGQQERHFVVAVPLETATELRLQQLRVVRENVILAEHTTTLAQGTSRVVREPVAMRLYPGAAHLSWDSEVHANVMVRDPRTGEVIAFLRGGSAMIASDATELEFTFSDGVRSERKILRVFE